jgi:putative hemolysin
MKKIIWVTSLSAAIFLVLFVAINRKSPESKQVITPATAPEEASYSQEETNAGLANPASVYCEENQGTLEITTESDGSQFGLCNLGEYSCEEWAFFRGECDTENDSQLIRQALIDKGLNLTNMKVVIYKHLGKYIEAGVVPVSEPAGGGYVFAVKNEDGVKIVADGNGAIMCSSLESYPDFPSYLIPECIDDTTSSPVVR